MASRKNEVVFVCDSGDFFAALVAVQFGAPPLVPSSVLVLIAAVLPMVINNRFENEESI